MVFGVAEHIVPPGRFLPGLCFRQVEVRAAAFRQQSLMVVEEVEREIKQAAGDRFSTLGDVFFRQMQTAHTANQYRRVWFELVNFARIVGVTDGAIDRIAQVDLPFDDFVPVRCQ